MRLALLGLALGNMLIALLGSWFALAGTERSPWEIIIVYVCPVLAPLFVVVLLFDYVMSRVRAAEAQGDERARFIRIGRIELVAIGVTLLYWVPFFVSIVR